MMKDILTFTRLSCETGQEADAPEDEEEVGDEGEEAAGDANADGDADAIAGCGIVELGSLNCERGQKKTRAQT